MVGPRSRGRWALGPAGLVAWLGASCTLLSPYPELTEDSRGLCRNGIDDDRDSHTDCADPDCRPHCRETGSEACTNGIDDDSDGAIDHHEPACWPHHPIVVGTESEGADASRCASIAGSEVALAEDTPGWLSWPACPAGGPCPLWTGDPLAASGRALRLAGGTSCEGSGVLDGDCERAVAPEDVTGGPCWTLELEVALGGPTAGLAVIAAPGLRGASHPLRVAEDPAVVDLVRAEDGAGGAEIHVGYAADGRRAVAVLPVAGDPVEVVHVTVTATGRGSCDAGAYGSLSVVARSGTSEVTLERWPEETLLAPPVRWRTDAGVRIALQTTRPGETWTRAFAMRRQGREPCGYPMPQLTSATGGAVTLSAARGDGRICVLGATTPALDRTLGYDPGRAQGWPPELTEADAAALLPRALASWHVEDLGLASFSTLPLGPFVAGTEATEGRAARAAALAWNEVLGRFEAVVLLSPAARRGGDLVLVTSTDCERWERAPEGELPAELGAATPVAFDVEAGARRLVVATPAEGYAAGPDPDPRCTTEVEAGFHADTDVAAYIKPFASECMVYPRGGLREARSGGAGPFVAGDELAALPAFDRWRVGCGCLAFLDDATLRAHPHEVHQLVELGGDHTFVTTGALGIEIVVDDAPGAGADDGLGPADARLLPEPLLGPSGILGTFDAARVTEGRLLWLGDPEPRCPVLGLLFYRGFDRIEPDPSLDARLARGGATGVVPVRIGPRAPGGDGGLERCLAE